MLTWVSALWRQWRTYPSAVPLDALLEAGFVALDLETTGLDPRRDTIVSIAALHVFPDTTRDSYVSLVNPGRPIPPASTAIHGITDAMVAAAPPLDEALRGLHAACAQRLVVGHRLEFDLAVVRRECRARGLTPPANRWLCTMRLAAALYPTWADVGLDAVAGRLAIPIPDRHTARGDALASARILLAVLPEIQRRGIGTLDELMWLQSTASFHG